MYLCWCVRMYLCWCMNVPTYVRMYVRFEFQSVEGSGQYPVSYNDCRIHSANINTHFSEWGWVEGVEEYHLSRSHTWVWHQLLCTYIPVHTYVHTYVCTYIFCDLFRRWPYVQMKLLWKTSFPFHFIMWCEEHKHIPLPSLPAFPGFTSGLLPETNCAALVATSLMTSHVVYSINTNDLSLHFNCNLLLVSVVYWKLWKLFDLN